MLNDFKFSACRRLTETSCPAVLAEQVLRCSLSLKRLVQLVIWDRGLLIHCCGCGAAVKIVRFIISIGIVPSPYACVRHRKGLLLIHLLCLLFWFSGHYPRLFQARMRFLSLLTVDIVVVACFVVDVAVDMFFIVFEPVRLTSTAFSTHVLWVYATRADNLRCTPSCWTARGEALGAFELLWCCHLNLLLVVTYGAFNAAWTNQNWLHLDHRLGCWALLVVFIESRPTFTRRHFSSWPWWWWRSFSIWLRIWIWIIPPWTLGVGEGFCIAASDHVFHFFYKFVRFLLNFGLAISDRFWVDVVLFTKLVPNISVLSHLHVYQSQLIFLHSCQLLLVCTF